MGTSGKFRQTRQGFTLVELLTVIVIIVILAGMITGAAIVARGMVKRTAVLAEIGQIDIALERYKNEFGEYPPDFAFVYDVGTVGDAARDRVLRHLRKRFPKYRPVGLPAHTTDWQRFCYDLLRPDLPVGDPNKYNLNPQSFDAASALVFWLGGLPDTALADPWIPRGFHSDPKRPFKAGSPRTDSFYEFDPERLVVANLWYIPRYIETAPLVYFKAVKSSVNGKYEYGEVGAGVNFLLLSFVDSSNPDLSICVPYLKEVTASGRSWESPEKYQIISAGMDSLFGNCLPFEAATPTVANFRVTSTGNFYPNGAGVYDDGDYDNLTSFSTAKLEDGIE